MKYILALTPLKEMSAQWLLHSLAKVVYLAEGSHVLAGRHLGI